MLLITHTKEYKNPDVVSDVSNEDNHNDDVPSQTPSPPHSTPEETYIPKTISVEDVSKALDEIDNEAPVESTEEHAEHKKKKHHGGVKHGKGKHGRMHHQHQLEIQESGKEVE